ncbi:MAG TPA: 6-phosphogluconolactonase [Candidatus Dormibacteraeota bacterium]|jgi:6-phosphogluconolactonase|nr:6-phosphogluconolactonase [Candidatus Dormibacteraeota bacterium]
MRDGGDTGLPGVVRIASTLQEWAGETASWLARCAEESRVEHGYFGVALTGGSTPAPLYERIAAPPYRHSVGWLDWMVYFGDERAVPPDDPQSNYRLAYDHLLSRVPVPEERVHRMEAERPDRERAADEYASILADTLARGPGGAPRLHCMLLGLGENGHIASLFPGTPSLDVIDRWVVPSVADYEPRDRLTVTFPVINASEWVAMLVTGAAKGPALRGVVDGRVPAARVRPVDGTLMWFLDEAAATAMRAAG